ncbi:uncharacterized protein si:dkey-245f22.3 [Amphiprion ocellaris]|uniref:uncharacterized protein si:dkey-245f22.3 n=1 Tax=Amphiprion ocellaris TaxID=80972 RepID=UPI001649CD75|nr:uncharacterized protein si:dkey-245f22.3 [Amphiprion ocellaris]
MDDKLSSTDMNEKMDERKLHDSQTGPFTDVSSFSEQISTEDTELSSADISVNVFPQKTKGVEGDVGFDVLNKPKSGASRTVSIRGACSVEDNQPKPLCALLPSSVESCTALEASQSFTSTIRNQESLKTSTVHIEPDGEDLVAAILLACLFCHPLDCLLATLRGFNGCVWSLCSSLCGCEPTTMQPLLDATNHCDLCGCLGVRCFLCDCPVCDICLQATECLDLAMEISQMLYH